MQNNRIRLVIIYSVLLNIILLGFTPTVIAQTVPTWQTYNSTNSPLPSDYINVITIDKDGSKWIGTYGGGLAHFDGTNWTIYTTGNSGLPSNYIHAITVDTDGSKWISTAYGGVAHFDGTTWNVYNSSNSPLPVTSDINGSIFGIAIDKDGSKWFGTVNGVAHFDGTNWTIFDSTNSGLPWGAIDIAIDQDGSKWFATHYGAVHYDGTNWTVYDTTNSGLTNNALYSVAIDNNDVKWFGGTETGGGVTSFDGITWTNYFTGNSGLPSNWVQRIVIGSSGEKWFATVNAGATKLDGSTWTVYNSSNSGLVSNAITSIAIDNNGNKWFGTTSGLSTLNDGVSIPPNTGCNKASITTGYIPSQINHAYGIDQLQQNGITGKNQKIAIISFYRSKNIEQEAKIFSDNFCLPGLKLTIHDIGNPVYDINKVGDWRFETALDVEWAHATAPDAEIILIVTNSDADNPILAALDYAIQNGASVVSMSFGKQFTKTQQLEARLSTSSVIFVGATGEAHGNQLKDIIYSNPNWPAISSHVLAVGGTNFNLDKTGNRIDSVESAWSASVGGYSGLISQPTYQKNYGIPAPDNRRSIPDVSFDYGKVAIYTTISGWTSVGGTSFGTPEWAGLIALANQGRNTKLSNIHNILYDLATKPDTDNKYFRVITQGSSNWCYKNLWNFFLLPGTCFAKDKFNNYDLATGLGTPRAEALVPYLTSFSK